MKRVAPKLTALSGNSGNEKARNLSLNPHPLLQAFKAMLTARRVDEKAIVLYKQNKCHFQIGCAGHEAVQVAMAQSLKAGHDWIFPYYRDMALCVALGMTPRELLLNVLNKADDPNSGGRQMPMHYGHKDLRIVSQSSPTGTQFMQAVGAACAARYNETNEVVYVSAGEGTTSQGSYHEALNWAAKDKLPMIFLIQNNKYAISVHISEQIAGESVARISSGYDGLEVVTINGLDYQESVEATRAAVKRARSGKGPTMIEADVVRLQSHSISDNQAKYRPAEEIQKDKTRDPLKLLRDQIVRSKISTSKELDQIENEVQRKIDEDAEWAEAQRDPSPASFSDYVLVDSYPPTNIIEKEPTEPELFMVDALNKALDEELSANPDVLIFGQDVAHGKGGVFTVTSGLTKKHGANRVFNSPLAEESIAGAAVGMAAVGLRPVAEIQFGDYVWTAAMQIRNELAMMNYRSGGNWTSPAVLRIPVGGYIHGGMYHSQCIEGTFSHFPGLVVLMPSNATDAKGLLKSAIRSKDPVLFLEHKGLYRQVFAKGKVGGIDDLIPIGLAKIVRSGTQATIISWGALVHRSLTIASKLEQEGFDIEVIDLRTISPLDTQTILKSVKKTGRVLIAHEDVKFMGFGAEISAIVADQAFEYLDAPVKRVGAKFAPVPHSPVLEDVVLPQNDDIENALRELLRY